LSDHDPSTSQNIKYPHWQREFEAALIKADLQKLRQRVDAAEAALFLRSQALVEDPQGHAERQAISDAIRTLRTIQRETLGYPDWTKKL
jgi:fatty acid/phospholipid biosynthesis enzyme